MQSLRLHVHIDAQLSEPLGDLIQRILLREGHLACEIEIRSESAPCNLPLDLDQPAHARTSCPRDGVKMYR